jgi:Domain of unknown function (DUF4365)
VGAQIVQPRWIDVGAGERAGDDQFAVEVERHHGIDDSIEVFRDGEATGLFFFAQSRGTDNSRDGMKMFLSKTQQNYFCKVDEPVLLVRYHSPSGKTFAKWFHKVDPYPRSESQTIHFELSCELTSDNVSNLAKEVEIYRAWRTSRLEWPVRLVIKADGKRDQRELELAVFQMVGNCSVIKVGPVDPQGPALSVSVSDDEVVVDVSTASYTFHDDIKKYETRDLAPLVVLGAAFVLSSIGHPDRVGPLFEMALSKTLFTPDAMERAGVYIGEGGRIEHARRVGEHWLSIGTAPQLAPSILLLTAAAGAARASSDERQKVPELLERLGQAVTDRSDELAFLGFLGR